MPQPSRKSQIGQSESAAGQPARVILFTGHMIDAPDRPRPRFPAACEDVAARAIARAVAAEQVGPGGVRLALAGAASGGDILFHEACLAAGMPGEIHLALPRALYLAASVAPAGPGWVARFERLCALVPVFEPDGLPAKEPFAAVNLALLARARALGPVTLLALWDGAGGDGPGGTGDLVARAQAAGARIVALDTKRLFGL
jgi:hypothetical protein